MKLKECQLIAAIISSIVGITLLFSELYIFGFIIVVLTFYLASIKVKDSEDKKEHFRK